jgi:hypothetical protein
MGFLPGGQLVETDRSGLVAGYLGQTAIKTSEVVKKAIGGVLFIDEAYALVHGEHGGSDSDSYGQEAIETLLKAMEDNRDQLVVIVAGYTAPMQQFLVSNPGLQSRSRASLIFLTTRKSHRFSVTWFHVRATRWPTMRCNMRAIYCNRHIRGAAKGSVTRGLYALCLNGRRSASRID